MRSIFKLIIICFLMSQSVFSDSYNRTSKSSIIPAQLTCEYMSNPNCLDVKRPRFSWILQSSDLNKYGQKQSAYRILVSSSKSNLDNNKGDMWDSKWIKSDNSQLIEYSGNGLSSDKRYYWKVIIKDELGIESDYSSMAEWSTGLFSHNEWTAQWIGTSEVYDPAKGSNKMYDPWFRKSFVLSDKPASATLFVASVGYHEVYVNGQKIGDHVLAPVATDHTKRARYIAYDIAPALQSGNNAITIWLGTSWSIFAPYATADKPRSPLVIAQGDIYNSKNKRLMRIKTDESWKTHPSPNKLIGNWGFGVGGYGGEIWDANKEVVGWNLSDFNDSQWNNVNIFTPDLLLSAQQAETNKLFDVIYPIDIKERPDGSYRVDMGVNFAGWTEINVNGTPGDTVHFLYSEREQDDVTFNLHSAFVINESGKGVFRNHFNYSSGRWINIKGLSNSPNKDDIKGWMVRTDFPDATSFESSNDLQNWIYNTVNWTFENLSIGGYIVDCPQRERFGYGGDAHATSETGLLNYKLGAFYTKWLEDWRDVQGTEPMVGNMNDPDWARNKEGSGRFFGGGVLPQTAPTYHGGGGPAWGGIVVSLPWFLYQYNGDQRVLEDNFNMIKGWLSFLDSHVENNMLKRYGGQWDFLGDWLWPGATAQGMNNYSDENIFFNNCYWVYNLKTAIEIAKVLGRTEELAKWQQQANMASNAIHSKYFHPAEHNYSDKSMRSLAAALYGDIMPDSIRGFVMKCLEKEILINKNGHIDVGITGGAMLFKVLRDEGRDDLIYSMTSKTSYPSWGLMRESGATTIWEAWEKDLPGHSLLHSSYLYPGAWYIDGVAGIKRDDNVPGFRKFIVRIPNLTEDQINWARAQYDSPIGKITSEWKKENGTITLNLTVPPNSSASVLFPNVNGRVIKEASGYAKYKGVLDGYSVYEVPSGKFTFNN